MIRNCLGHALDYIVMETRKTNREQGYLLWHSHSRMPMSLCSLKNTLWASYAWLQLNHCYFVKDNLDRALSSNITPNQFFHVHCTSWRNLIGSSDVTFIDAKIWLARTRHVHFTAISLPSFVVFSYGSCQGGSFRRSVRCRGRKMFVLFAYSVVQQLKALLAFQWEERSLFLGLVWNLDHKF